MQAVVRDVMTRTVVAARETASFREVAAVMLDRHVSALPVLDSGDHVIGVVSEADLLVKEAAVADTSVWGSPVHGRRAVMATAELARDLMTSPAVTISPDAPVAEAARHMTAHRVKRLPVVSADDRLLGIISRVDVLSVFRRPDEEIRQDVISEIVAGQFGTDGLTVTVQSGIVTVTGGLPAHAAAVAMLAAIRHVEGVVNVRSQLSFPVESPAPPG